VSALPGVSSFLCIRRFLLHRVGRFLGLLLQRGQPKVTEHQTQHAAQPIGVWDFHVSLTMAGPRQDFQHPGPLRVRIHALDISTHRRSFLAVSNLGGLRPVLLPPSLFHSPHDGWRWRCRSQQQPVDEEAGMIGEAAPSHDVSVMPTVAENRQQGGAALSEAAETKTEMEEATVSCRSVPCGQHVAVTGHRLRETLALPLFSF